MADTISRSSTSLLRLTRLRLKLSQAYLNDATVTATIYDADDVLVEGPVTLDYVASSQGSYVGYVDPLPALAVGDTCYVLYNVVDTENHVSALRKSVTVIA